MWVKPHGILHTRVSEHLGISPIIGKPSSDPVMPSIFTHLNSTSRSANFNDFEILSSCSDTCELMIHESLLISKLKPSLKRAGQLNSAQPSIIHWFCVCSVPLFVSSLLSYPSSSLKLCKMTPCN